MIDYSTINIDKLIIHKVGNKHKEIKNEVSNTPLLIEDELSTHLINFFLTPFSKKGDVNKFTHHANVEMNELYAYSNNLFNNPNDFQSISVNIVNHLYAQSDHPHIKVGEVLIAYFTDIIFDDQITDALGIFKIERKQNYFKFASKPNNIAVDIESGINSKRLDKGCLIVNVEKQNGYRVLSVDNNDYDTEYWQKKFMNVSYVKDYHYHTSEYVEFCKSFSEDVLHKEKGKNEQIAFLNKSMNYLSKKDNLDINEFADEVLDEPEIKKEFFDYKKTFEQKRDTPVNDNFTIAQNTVKSKKRSIKSLITLDTNIQIKLNNKEPEKIREFIEKGFDRERDMHYYKVYYYSEID